MVPDIKGALVKEPKRARKERQRHGYRADLKVSLVLD
jgi:hypothetical protein